MKLRPSRATAVFDLLLLLGAVVLFYPRMGLPGSISPGGDMVNLMLPAREWAWQWLGQGVVPLWNPQTFGGVPFLGAMQAAVFYPLNMIVGAFASPLATINLLRVVHAYLFGALTWMFLRIERGVARPAALLGALAVAGSAHVASHTDHINQMAAMVWLPALVACQWRFWRTGSRLALLGFALALAFQILSGHPQAVFYSLLLNGAIAVGFVISECGMRNAECGAAKSKGLGENRDSIHPQSKIANRNPKLVCLFLLLLAVVGGCLLASIQVIPAAETAQLSRRSVDGLDYPLWGSMPRRHLLATVAPRAFGDPLSGFTDPEFGAESSAFVGRVTLAAALLAVGVGVARRRPYAIFWMLIVAAAFTLALGGYGPFGRPPDRPSPVFLAYLKLLPPARHLRVPPRILLLATFGLAVLGAEGLDWIMRRRWWTAQARRRWIRSIAGWGTVAVVVVELWAFQRGEFHNRVVGHHRPEILLTGRAREVLGPLLRPDPMTAPLADFRVFRLMPHDPDYLMDSQPAAVRNRYVRLQPNLGMLLGVAEVEGYEEGLLPPARYFDFLNAFNRNLRNPDPDAVLLGLMNVRYVYTDYNLAVASKTWRPAGEAVEPSTGRHYRLYENPLWLPRVLWADWLPDEVQAILGELRGPLSRGARPTARMTDSQNYGLDPDALAAKGPLVTPEKLADLPVRSIEPNRIRIANPTRRGGTLLVAQNAYPGWVVAAGDRAIPVRPTNDFAGAAEVPPGAAEIVVVYRPFSYRIGAYLSALALGLWVMLAVVSFGRWPVVRLDAGGYRLET